MKSNLISRSAMLETINEVDISDCTDIESIIDRIYAEAASVPAVDAVPVVRCEDCIYGKPNWLEGEEDGPPYCVVCKKHGSGLTTADFFCAFGEKREDAEEDG